MIMKKMCQNFFFIVMILYSGWSFSAQIDPPKYQKFVQDLPSAFFQQKDQTIQDPVRQYFWVYVSEQSDATLNDEMLTVAKKSLEKVKQNNPEKYDWMVFYSSDFFCKKIGCVRQKSINQLLKKYPNNVYLNLQNGTARPQYTYETAYHLIFPHLVFPPSETLLAEELMDKDSTTFGLRPENSLAMSVFSTFIVIGDIDNQRPCMRKIVSEDCRDIFTALLEDPNQYLSSNQFAWSMLNSFCTKNGCTKQEYSLLESQKKLIENSMSPKNYPLSILQMVWTVNNTVDGRPLCDPMDFKNKCYKGPQKNQVKKSVFGSDRN